MDINNYKLEFTWNLWNHNLNDKSWKNDSYENIYSFENLYDIQLYTDILNITYLQNSMYFLMRKDIFPTWEDINNKHGCCASFKIPLNDVKLVWIKILKELCTENIHTNIDKYNDINGISICPKKEFNIIKIWFKIRIKNIKDYININDKYIIPKNCIIKNN
jgi:hypothetical protein